MVCGFARFIAAIAFAPPMIVHIVKTVNFHDTSKPIVRESSYLHTSVAGHACCFSAR